MASIGQGPSCAFSLGQSHQGQCLGTGKKTSAISLYNIIHIDRYNNIMRIYICISILSLSIYIYIYMYIRIVSYVLYTIIQRIIIVIILCISVYKHTYVIPYTVPYLTLPLPGSIQKHAIGQLILTGSGSVL